MSDRIYDRPVGYLPAYELSRLHSGHGAQLRSARFGPSALDGDVPVYLGSSALALVQALIGAQRAINSMKVEAETAAQGDDQMMLDACEQISNEGLEASLAIQAALSTAAQPPASPPTVEQVEDSMGMGHGVVGEVVSAHTDYATVRWSKQTSTKGGGDPKNSWSWPIAGTKVYLQQPERVLLTNAQFVAAIEAAGFKTWDSRMWELKRLIETAHDIKPKEQSND